MPVERIKVLFEINRDEDGYPPADIEHLWAESLGNNLFKIDNVPFFVKGISCEDIIEAFADSKGDLRYRSLVKQSTHSTLRVIVFRDSPDARTLEERVADLRKQLERVGCSTELSHLPGLVAVDMDIAVTSNALETLQAGEKADLWEYEEAALRS